MIGAAAGWWHWWPSARRAIPWQESALFATRGRMAVVGGIVVSACRHPIVLQLAVCCRPVCTAAPG